MHTLPKTEQGQLDKGLLCNWMRGADIVFSLGATESNELQRFVHGKVHHVYIPVYPIKPRVGIRTEQKLQKVTLIVGKREMGYNGTNVELAVAATIQAVERSQSKVETQFVFLGQETADESDLETLFNDTIQAQKAPENILKFCFLSSQEKKHSEMILKTCEEENALVLFPLKKNYSVFGLEALTAVSAGVPILVSDNSGVVALLDDMGDEGHSVVRHKNGFNSNVRAWTEKIWEKISDQSKARAQAAKLRENLLRSTKIETNHLEFVSRITRMLILFCQ